MASQQTANAIAGTYEPINKIVLSAHHIMYAATYAEIRVQLFRISLVILRLPRSLICSTMYTPYMLYCSHWMHVHISHIYIYTLPTEVCIDFMGLQKPSNMHIWLIMHWYVSGVEEKTTNQNYNLYQWYVHQCRII